MKEALKLAVLTAVSIAAAPRLRGDDDAAEMALKRFFEGRSVVVRVDMPATSSGIDLYPEREYPLDFSKAADRMRSSGVAVREGDRITVTRIKVKDDLIEFHLGGGGFNAFKDGSGTMSPTTASKSRLERDLERDLKNETDERRRRDLRRELDSLRREREREDARYREIAEATNELRRERDRQRALEMGSRFNIRFEKKDVPPDYLTPEGVMRALEKLVDFKGLGPRPPERPEDLRLVRPDGEPSPSEEAASDDDRPVRKGMTRAEVEAICGRPLREDESQEGVLHVRVAKYRRGQDRVEVTYVDDVVVRVEPKAPR
jgi:hypothetical protein